MILCNYVWLCFYVLKHSNDYAPSHIIPSFSLKTPRSNQINTELKKQLHDVTHGALKEADEELIKEREWRSTLEDKYKVRIGFRLDLEDKSSNVSM